MRKVFLYTLTLLLLLPGLAITIRGEVRLDGEEVVFTYNAQEGSDVYLVGDFNGWNPTIDKMVFDGESYTVNLFLLPGKHRYLFVIDGEKLRDTGNPCVDNEGNSCFYFRESTEGYTLGFSGVYTAEADVDSLDYYFYTSSLGLLRDGDFTGSVSIGFKGSQDENGLEISAGFLENEASGDRFSPYLAGAEAVSLFRQWEMKAFYRRKLLSMGDPLDLFGKVGPYKYPLGLFCRGAKANVRFAERLMGTVFYANRLTGYTSGLETLDTNSGGDSPDHIVFTERDPLDNDIIGLRLGGNVGELGLDYLLRINRSYSSFALPEYGWDRVLSGREEVKIHGIVGTYFLPDSAILEAELLAGETSLQECFSADSTDQIYQCGGDSGVKMYLGIRSNQGSGFLKAYYAYERIEAGHGKRNPSIGRMHSSGISIRGRLWNRFIVFSGLVEEFTGCMPDRFWLQRNNFFLDGDRIEVSRLLFLRSSGIANVSLNISDSESEIGSMPVPGRSYLTMEFFCDSRKITRRVLEARLVKSIDIGSITSGSSGVVAALFKGADLLVDFRGVSYNHEEWKGRKNFIDTFIGLRKSFNGSFFLMAGAGLNPFVFDKWYYGIIPDGRLRFLEERGVIEGAGSLDEGRLIEVIGDAESDMQRNWSFSIEGRFEF